MENGFSGNYATVGSNKDVIMEDFWKWTKQYGLDTEGCEIHGVDFCEFKFVMGLNILLFNLVNPKISHNLRVRMYK